MQIKIFKTNKKLKNKRANIYNTKNENKKFINKAK